MWEQLNRIIKPNGAIVLFGSEPFSSALRMSNIKNYKYDWIWEKDKVTGFLNSKRQPLRNFENILVFYKKQSLYNPQFTKKDPKNIRPLPKSKEFKKRDVVFTAKVLSIEDEQPPERNNYYRKVKMELLCAYKGELNKIEIVETLVSSASCGYHFQIGTTYLVYGTQYRVGGYISTNICTRTRPLAYAEKDIKKIKRLKKF